MDDALGEALPLQVQGHQRKLRVSCDACAARKVRCGRERPTCQQCIVHGRECNYSPEPSRRGKRNDEIKSSIEDLKPRQSDQKPSTISFLEGLIDIDPVHYALEQPQESEGPSDASPGRGYHTFIWRHPANEVFVTGSFDGWSKSIKMDRRGNIFNKAVNLPRSRTTYKFVVDGVLTLDPTAPTEEYGQGVYNNVLLAEEIVDVRWAEIKRNAARRAAQGQSEGQESGDESMQERVARIKARVAELTRSGKDSPTGNPPVDVVSYENLELELPVQIGSSGGLDDETTSLNPKLDRILSELDDEPARHVCEANDVSDLWFPIPRQTVKRLLSNERKTKAFLQAQEDVLDSNFQLLGGSPRSSRYGSGHISIDDDEGHIRELRVLGEGGCGIVEEILVTTSYPMVECVRKRIGRTRQLKALRKVMAAFAREIGVMRQVDHHHFVQFVGSYTDNDHINILSYPVAEMDLATFLDLPVHNKEREILYRGFGCLCSAINYLHQRNIRHEDLKPQNVLLHGENILLTDFGFSLDFSDDSVSTTTGRPSAWTIRYSAPEVLDFEPRNRASDIWSLGCILLEMVSAFNGTSLSDLKDRWKHTGSGQSSFARNNEAVRKWFKDETVNPSLPHTVRHFCYLIRSMLKEDRRYRPTAQQIVDRIFDISSLVFDYDTEPITAICHGPRPCIELSYSEAHRKYPFLIERLRGTTDLMECLHPNRYANWHWEIFDLDWNAIDSDTSISNQSAQWTLDILQNSYVKPATEALYKIASRSGTTEAHWRAHRRTHSSKLSQSSEGRSHARSSAVRLSVKHAVFRRLSLHTMFLAGAKEEGRRHWLTVQFTLLPINLPRSPFFGSFFWMLSWPRDEQELEPDGGIIDLTVLDWPR